MERLSSVGFGSVLLVCLMSGEFPLQSGYYGATRRSDADAAMISKRERFSESRRVKLSVYGIKWINY